MQTSWLVIAAGVFVSAMGLFSAANAFRIPLLAAQRPDVGRRILTLIICRDAGFRLAVGATCLALADAMSTTTLGAAFSIALAITFLFDGLVQTDPRVRSKVQRNRNPVRLLALASASCFVVVAYLGLRVA